MVAQGTEGGLGGLGFVNFTVVGHQQTHQFGCGFPGFLEICGFVTLVLECFFRGLSAFRFWFKFNSVQQLCACASQNLMSKNCTRGSVTSTHKAVARPPKPTARRLRAQPKTVCFHANPDFLWHETQRACLSVCLSLSLSLSCTRSTRTTK